MSGMYAKIKIFLVSKILMYEYKSINYLITYSIDAFSLFSHYLLYFSSFMIIYCLRPYDFSLEFKVN